jgi:hypothetical protein
MTIPPGSLPGVRRLLRRALPWLADNEVLDLVFLGAVVANFSPTRSVPLWLAIVGPPESGKTELTSMLQGWKRAETTPDTWNEGTILSARTEKRWVEWRDFGRRYRKPEPDRSWLLRIQKAKTRILYTRDMHGLIEVDRKFAHTIYSQMIGIHDGYLRKETGYESIEITYGEVLEDGTTVALSPAERIGWIAAATPEFYDWQSRRQMIGTRFTAWYHCDSRHWTDYEGLADIELRRAESARHLPIARSAVHAFLDQCVQHAEELADVKLDLAFRQRIAATAKLVQKIVGTEDVTGSGGRIQNRAVELLKAIAFMHGRQYVLEHETAIGTRLVLSQLSPAERNVVDFALHPDRIRTAWKMGELIAAQGLSRRIYTPVLERMRDCGILRESGNRGQEGFRYVFTAEARKLAEVFDPELRSQAAGKEKKKAAMLESAAGE